MNAVFCSYFVYHQLALWRLFRHGQLSVLSFSDGHAIKHKWNQKSTLEMTFVPYPDCIRWPATDGTDDLQYMRRGYNPAR